MSSPVALVRRMFTEMVEAKDATVIGDFYHPDFELGIHRFYTGQAGLGIALLLQTLILVPLTLGIWALVVIIWVIIDFILILTGSVTDKYGRPLV